MGFIEERLEGLDNKEKEMGLNMLSQMADRVRHSPAMVRKIKELIMRKVFPALQN